IRGDRDRRRRQEADIALACGCDAAPPTREEPARATGAVHGSTPVEHWPDCARVSRSVESRRTVPPVEEGGRRAMGTVASVGGWVSTSAYLCNRAWTDAGESGQDRAWNRRLRLRDDGRLGPDQRNIGTYDN